MDCEDLTVRLDQKKVTCLLPASGKDGTFADSPGRLIDMVKMNLARAGIAGQKGLQVVWLVPKDAVWGSLFQVALYEETGFFPVTVHRWRFDGERMVKKGLVIMDGQGMMASRD